MDYRAEVTRHRDWDSFRDSFQGRLILMTTRSDRPVQDFPFEDSDTLLFGSEGAGVPEIIHEAADARLTIPLTPGARSLNLAVACGIGAAAAAHQLL